MAEKFVLFASFFATIWTSSFGNRDYIVIIVGGVFYKKLIKDDNDN